MYNKPIPKIAHVKTLQKEEKGIQNNSVDLICNATP